MTVISQKEGELNATQAALAIVEAKASIDVAAARSECKATTKAKMAAIRAEVDKAIAATQAEAEKAFEDEFRASLFQGYSDLKSRVVLNHPE